MTPEVTARPSKKVQCGRAPATQPSRAVNRFRPASGEGSREQGCRDREGPEARSGQSIPPRRSPVLPGQGTAQPRLRSGHRACGGARTSTHSNRAGKSPAIGRVSAGSGDPRPAVLYQTISFLLRSLLRLTLRRFSQQSERRLHQHFPRAGLRGGIRDFVAPAGIGGPRGNVDGLDAV